MSDACLRYASCDKRFDGAVTGSSAHDIAFTPARLHARTHRVHLCGRVNKVPARRLSFSPPLCMSILFLYISIMSSSLRSVNIGLGLHTRSGLPAHVPRYNVVAVGRTHTHI